MDSWKVNHNNPGLKLGLSVLSTTNDQVHPDITVSVVVPTHNVGRFISRALESILNQSTPPEEIIVVDAESTDDTLERVRHLKDAVRLIQQPKAGISAGRNEGIRSARYDWIAFLDGDDEWLPDYLENQRGLLARNPHLVWSGTNYYIRQYETGKQAPAVDPRHFI